MLKNVLILGLAAIASAQIALSTRGLTDGGIACTKNVSVTQAEIMAARWDPRSPGAIYKKPHAASLASRNWVTNQEHLCSGRP